MAVMFRAEPFVRLTTKLTVPLHHVTLWTDLTTILAWLQSDTLGVIVCTQVTETHDLTDPGAWRRGFCQQPSA